MLIIGEEAESYARYIAETSGGKIPLVICPDVQTAREQYQNHEIAIGQPDMLAEVLPDMPSIRWVQSTWAGVAPLLTLSSHPFRLTGVKGIFGTEMSEYVLAYLLTHELKLFQRAASQEQKKWFDESSGSLKGKRAGIMGTGSIGSHIAITLGNLGVNVDGLNLSGSSVEGFQQVYPVTAINSFLGKLDYLISVLPDTRETDHLLDASRLSCLPKHAVLINIGRANVIDHAALIDSINGQQLGGAILDVFGQEPLPAENALWNTPGIVITAHVAAQSRAKDIAPVFCRNYQNYAHGNELDYEIDFNRGY